MIPPEPHYVYSNRSYWYPQATVTDYATAQAAHHACRQDFDVVASGTPQGRRRRPGRSRPASARASCSSSTRSGRRAISRA